MCSLLHGRGEMTRQNTIQIHPGRRSGKPRIRSTQITVYDVLECSPVGMSEAQVLKDSPGLRRADVRTVFERAADRERRLKIAST